MVRRRQSDSKMWWRRLWGVAAVLVAASLGPVIYCFGWATPPGDVAVSVGYCVDVHPLRFPATIFICGMLSAVAGFVVRHQAMESQKEAERQERRLEQKVVEASRESARTPHREMGARGARGGPEPVPEAIDVGDELGFEESDDGDERRDSNSPMAFLEEQQNAEEKRRQRAKERGRTDRDYYVPPGMEDGVELYVDADVDGSRGDDLSERIDAPKNPYGELDEALRDALRIVMERGRKVVVRLRPGVYATSVELPGQVSIVNHEIPVSATVDERLGWLREQTDIDHPERVTLLVSGDTNAGVRAVAAEGQGLFGCHLVGRQGVDQVGLEVRDNGSMAVVHCVFESFRGGGAEVVDSGEDLPGQRVQFVGCIWRGNTAPRRGGALRIEGSVARIEASILENNRAPRAGAVWVSDLDKPLVVKRTLLRRNRALGDDDAPAPDDVAPEDWGELNGVGGGLLVRDGLVKLVDTIVEGNDADQGGGGIAVLGARVIVESTGDGRGVVAENRSAAGGGALVVGSVERAAMLRLREAEFEKNLGTSLAGGVGIVGNAMLQAEDARFDSNRADVDGGGSGGGVGIWCGGAVRFDGGQLTGNDAGAGGAIAVRNGSLKLDGGLLIDRNDARCGPGGGLLVVTAADRRLDRLIGEEGFDLPFKLRIGEVRITGNSADGPGGGLRAGSMGTSSAFPLVIDVRRPNWIANNEATTERRHAQNLWIEWAGKMKSSDETKGRVELKLK